MNSIRNLYEILENDTFFPKSVFEKTKMISRKCCSLLVMEESMD